jgi:two-component system nitrate/nitrite response regulator NarL
MSALNSPQRRKEIARSALDRGICGERIEELVRLLTAAVTDADGRNPGDTPECSQEIILDTDVDGWRFLLVRLPQATRTASTLSPREHEIVRMVAEGHPNKVIADVLNISSWTVCTHLRRIFAKLGVNSRAAMVAHLLEIETSSSKHPPPQHPSPPPRDAAAKVSAGLQVPLLRNRQIG